MNEQEQTNKDVAKLRKAYRILFEKLREEHNQTMEEFNKNAKKLSELSVRIDDVLAFMEGFTR